MTKPRKAHPPKRILNRRARYDFNLQTEYVVGIALTGAETKALRMGWGQLTGSYVTVKDNQLWLINMRISGSGAIRIEEQEQTRTRALLAKRKEIDQLIQAKQQGRTIIPVELLTHGRFIKLKIAVAQGKKNYDKRQTIKQRSEERQMAAAIKQRR